MENLTFDDFKTLYQIEADVMASEYLTSKLQSFVVSNGNGYMVYDEKTTLHKDKDAKDIQTFLQMYVAKSFEALTDEQKYYLRSQFKKTHQSYMGTARYKSMESNFSSQFKREQPIKYDMTPYALNCKNGVIDLRTGEFRKRTHSDYYTLALDWDYDPNVSSAVVNEVKQIFHSICNSNDEMLEFCLRWYAYCITGEIDLKKFVMFTGISADNGKTTSLKIMSQVFQFYVKKLDKEMFSTKSTDKHKFQIHCDVPTRLIYVEELSTELMASDALKEFSGGDSDMKVKELYKTKAKEIEQQCKLITIGNKMSRFKNDSGMETRILHVVLENRFLDAERYQAAAGEKGVFMRDTQLTQKFALPAYRNALLALLMPFVKQYYATRTIVVPKQVHDATMEICTLNDPMKQFILDTIKITKDSKDRISKEDFESAYQYHSKLQGTATLTIIEEAKRHGIDYEASFRVKDCEKRGCFVGVRFLTEEEKNQEGAPKQPDVAKPPKPAFFVETKIKPEPEPEPPSVEEVKAVPTFKVHAPQSKKFAEVKSKLAKTQKLIDNLGQDLKRTTKNAPPDEDIDDTFLILF